MARVIVSDRYTISINGQSPSFLGETPEQPYEAWRESRRLRSLRGGQVATAKAAAKRKAKRAAQHVARMRGRK